jgi:hypothetical protein
MEDAPMALRLGEYVVYGELYNTRNNCTHGLLALRAGQPGEETFLRFELTGNCEEDLKGKGIRFYPDSERGQGEVFVLEEHPALQLHQIGPTGVISASGWVRTFDCSREEFLQRARLGEPVPTEWKRRLYLEWFGQNGRLVVEMGGVAVEEMLREPATVDDEGEWAPLANSAPHPESMVRPEGPDEASSLSACTTEDEETLLERWRPVREELEREEPTSGGISAELQRRFDVEAAAIDQAIFEGAEEVEEDDEHDEDDEEASPPRDIADFGLDLDAERVPLASLVGDSASLPPAEALNDTEAEHWLKLLLGRLALRGVTLDVCEHYTPCDAYRYLVETVLVECETYPEAADSGWVQHFSTWEDCAQCEAELERQYEASQGELDR